MKLNKILALLIAFAMIFSFVACGNAANPVTEDETPSDEQVTPENPGQDNTTTEDPEEPEDPEIKPPEEGATQETSEAVMKVYYANLPPEGQTWSQPNKFQFALANFDVNAGDSISIMILPLERTNLPESLMRENGNKYIKFLPTTTKLITEGEWAGWYEMSCIANGTDSTTGEVFVSSSGVMFTFYNTVEFTPGEDSSIAWPVYVAQVKVNDTIIPLDEIDAVKALTADIEYEVIHEIPTSRLEKNLAAAGVTPGTSTEEGTEGTEGGESTETPAEGSAE